MIRQMSFQSKLVVTYSVFIIVLMLFLGFSFYYYNSYNYEKNAYSSLSSLAKKISQQLDYCVQTMDYLSLDVISYEDLRNALGDLAYLDRDDPENIEPISRSMQIIRGHTVRDSIIKTAHRMSVFNLKGDFFTSISNVDSYNASLMHKIAKLIWVEKAKSKKGGKYLVTPSMDVWAEKNPIKVFSLVRVIKTPLDEVGFVEVQNPVDKLKQICSVGVNESIKVLVINDENNIVYSNKTMDDASLRYYTSLSEKKDSDFFTARNPVTKSAEIISRVSSGYTGWTVFVMQNRAELLQPLAFTRNLTFIIGLALTMVTFIGMRIKIGKLLVEIFAVSLTLLVLVPFYFTLVNSFKSSTEAAWMQISLPKTFHILENYKEVFIRGNLIRALWNSTLITVCSIAVLVVISSMAAFVLQRRKDRFTRVLDFFVLAGLIVPPAIVPTLWTLRILHIDRTKLSLILIEAVISFSFAALLYKGFFSTIPQEIDEAAIVDGCGNWRMFFQIILPLLMPVTITITIISGINIFNDFINPLYFLSGAKNATMQLTIYYFTGQYNSDWNLVFADIVLISLPPLIFYLFMNKKIIDGMVAGSIKA